jgi:hypothetical protein
MGEARYGEAEPSPHSRRQSRPHKLRSFGCALGRAAYSVAALLSFNIVPQSGLDFLAHLIALVFGLVGFESFEQRILSF